MKIVTEYDMKYDTEVDDEAIRPVILFSQESRQSGVLCWAVAGCRPAID
jgi:hypothetical protein